MLDSVFRIPHTGSQDVTSRPDGRLRQFIGGPENSLLTVAVAWASPDCVVPNALATPVDVGQPHRGEWASDGNDVTDTLHEYNPILFYGPNGVGKTHLLNVLAEQIQADDPDALIVTLTGSDYARAIQVASELDAFNELRSKHRTCDLLIIDDLQELKGKQAAQGELLHTIDERTDHGRRTLFTSPAAPAEMMDLESGLISRLTSGLIVPIAQPGPAARCEIIVQLANELQLQLPPDVLELLTTTGNHQLETVAQLRSVLLELSTFTEQPIRLRDVRAVLKRANEGPDLSTRQITAQAARHFQLRSAELTGPSRRQATVRARGVAIYLVRKLTGQSLEEIGRHFGQRDHSTILHSFRKIEKAKETDPLVRKSIHEIADRLGALGRVR